MGDDNDRPNKPASHDEPATDRPKPSDFIVTVTEGVDAGGSMQRKADRASADESRSEDE